MEKHEMHEVEQGFYQRCAELLGVPNTYRPRHFKKVTRWNNREAGNGRFEGCGLIRMFAGSHVHMALVHPIKVNKWFSKPEDAITFLEMNL